MENQKVAVLIGTRPGIVKMTPLVHELRNRDLAHMVIHSGQHYSKEMDTMIMHDVGLDDVDHHIYRDESWVTHARQTAYMLTAIEDILLRDKPSVLLVCGDANTNFAGALAARKINVRVGHVEAGLRSFDWLMPEEHNRVMIDHISELLFAPTEQARRYLAREHVKGSVFVVGNTIVDSVYRFHKDPARQTAIRERLSLHKPFVLLTMHRQENVDDPERLSRIIRALNRISYESEAFFLFPMHPRTRKMLDQFELMDQLAEIPGIRVIDPLGYRDFLTLTSMAQMVMTDSGGLQEESCILGVPCVTLRENTERPETVTVGSNTVAGISEEGICSAFRKMRRKADTRKTWDNPYGDGRAAQRIIDTCIDGRPNDEFRR